MTVCYRPPCKHSHSALSHYMLLSALQTFAQCTLSLRATVRPANIRAVPSLTTCYCPPCNHSHSALSHYMLLSALQTFAQCTLSLHATVRPANIRTVHSLTTCYCPPCKHSHRALSHYTLREVLDLFCLCAVIEQFVTKITNNQSTRLYLIGTALHVADQSIHNQMYTSLKFTGSASHF